MTSLDPDGVTVAALGPQAQSSRQSAPVCAMSKVTRHHFEKVFISPGHTKTARIGRESPLDGPNYEVMGKMGTGSAVSFANSVRRKERPIDDPDDIPTNDALNIAVDSQPYKYRRDPKIVIGTDPRGRLKDAELLKCHSAAFYGRQSPGPAAIGETYGPSIGPTKPSLTHAAPFGTKTKVNWLGAGDNPPNMGPGAHERNDHAIGAQHLSQRRNQSVHRFPRDAKFPKNRYQDSISVLDAARSCMGNQVLGKNRSEPSAGFARDTRATRDKTAICRTRLDEGPKAALPRFTCSMPNLPMERVVMKSGLG